MNASQQCRAAGPGRACKSLASVLLLTSASSYAGDPPQSPGCDTVGVHAHVREQFGIYGPRSQKHEFFGFIFRVEGELFSAVVRSSECSGPYNCKVDTTPAAMRIPRGAKVLGEWHTHSHLSGSRMLSIEDVRGAHHNARIRCYTAFYAGPEGEIHGWDPRSTSVMTAMASRTPLGRYERDGVGKAPDPAKPPTSRHVATRVAMLRREASPRGRSLRAAGAGNRDRDRVKRQQVFH